MQVNSQLLKRLCNIQKPFSAVHWQFSSPAAMIGVAILIAVVSFAVWKKCCAQALQTTNVQQQQPLQQLPPLAQSQPQPKINAHQPQAPSAPAYSHQNLTFQLFKTDSPCSHLYLTKGKAPSVLHSYFQNSRFYFYISLYISFFTFVSDAIKYYRNDIPLKSSNVKLNINNICNLI